MASNLDYLHNCKHLPGYLKPNIESGEWKSVYPLWIALIGRPRIVTQNADDCLLLLLRNLFQ